MNEIESRQLVTLKRAIAEKKAVLGRELGRGIDASRFFEIVESLEEDLDVERYLERLLKRGGRVFDF